MVDSHILPRAPRWVPKNAWRYLLHTEHELSIRDLARAAQCHASTILRQIRRIETRRDDPLVDAALVSLARTYFPEIDPVSGIAKLSRKMKKGMYVMENERKTADDLPDTVTLNAEAARVLRRLCETGAVLAVAENMEKAVVVRDDGTGANARTAVVDSGVARAMALKQWIHCANPGRLSRYYITATGRSALGKLVAEQENQRRSDVEVGFAEERQTFNGKGSTEITIVDPDDERPRRVRYNMAESPLIALARRKDKDGKPFLSDDLVRAGERLREDFELSQMGPRVAQNWDRFLTGGARGDMAQAPDLPRGPAAARDRVAAALTDMGPGLSEVALRCCCHLEGLETAERRLGWSARSGKIVLRIALQRLKRHYDTTGASDRMIG
ncbi:MAG: DUF6456 domain-containing protein [Pseudomonadota bacterium]|nr:DUF6456 domain-containing protein [Pseudomonadota bacterium]